MNTRANAALAEINNLLQGMIQRNVNLAGDLAECGEALTAAQAEIVELKKKLTPAADPLIPPAPT